MEVRWLQVVSVISAILPVAFGLSCKPERITTKANFNPDKFVGRWFVFGRHDEWAAVMLGYNQELHVSKKSGHPPFHPHGDHILEVDMIGRNDHNHCVGAHYKWGQMPRFAGRYKHKLAGAMHYSLFDVLATDYTDYAVVSVCRTNVMLRTIKYYCTALTVLVLKRQRPQRGDRVEHFDTTEVWERLKGACRGQLKFALNRHVDINAEGCLLQKSYFKTGMDPHL